VFAIPNSIDLARVGSAFTPAQARHQLGLPAAAPVIGIVGRLEPIKRVDLLLHAAAQMRSALPDLTVVIAGDGSQVPALQALTSRLGISSAVRFLGHRDDPFDLLRALDLLVISSDHEGLPMVLLEALALRVPVVARAVGGIPEVLREGAGVLVSGSDASSLAAACLRVLQDPALRAAMAEKGWRRVSSDFGAAANAARVVELYSSLCGAR
jgi:glycosyltransferase involved in cell wall biosynthesis